MAHPLDGALLKVARAYEQEAALALKIDRFLAGNPYEATFENDPGQGEQIIRIKVSQEVPPLSWSVDLGEILHNLRSALEHVIWQLIIHDGGVPMPGRYGFPVFTSKTKYRENGQSMIRGVGQAGRAIIDSAQPFTEGRRAEETALYVLNQLWHVDKHRTLHLMRAMTEVAEVSLGPAEGLVIESQRLRDPGPVRDGDEIARLRLAATQQQASVKVRVRIPQDIVFEETDPACVSYAPVRVNLSVLGGQVESLVQRFVPLFD